VMGPEYLVHRLTNCRTTAVAFVVVVFIFAVSILHEGT